MKTGSNSSDWNSGSGALEERLYRQLGIPIGVHPEVRRGWQAAQPDSIHVALNSLRRELHELEREAARIGRLPKDYPRHVDLVMRAISAVLPWYTRPIVQFSRRTVVTAETTVRLLEEVLKRQEAFSAEIASLKKAASPPANGFRIHEPSDPHR